MTDRSAKWHDTRRAREMALFAGRRFEIVREITDESFTTPLGYKAKSGYEVRNVENNETFCVGKSTLRKMADVYSAVDLPAPKKRGRPKKVSGGVVSGPRDPQDDTILYPAQSGSHPGPTYANPNAGEEATEYEQ